MGCDDDLVGIGLALVIVAGVMVLALNGSFDRASTDGAMRELGAMIGSALHAAAGALGI